MKICLIGSTKFKDKYNQLNKDLTLSGHVVYTVAFFGNSGDTITEKEKEILDLVHLKKILESDAVVIVTDETGYVGDSTKREILWAKMLHKTIHSSQYISHIQRLYESLDKMFPVIK